MIEDSAVTLKENPVVLCIAIKIYHKRIWGHIFGSGTYENGRHEVK